MDRIVSGLRVRHCQLSLTPTGEETTIIDDRRHQAAQLLSVAVLAGICWFVAQAPAHALSIVPHYESSWTTNAPAAASAAVNTVISTLEGDFNNNVTVNLQFGWGDLNGSSLPSNALGVTSFNLSSAPAYSLSQVESLINGAATANPTNAALNIAALHLPSLTSSYASSQFFVPDAEYKALTGGAQNGDTIDAYLGFGSGVSWDYSGGKPSSNSFDFAAVLEHEMTHALGRVDYGFSSSPPPFLTPLNLYTYDCGTTTLDANFNNTCLSLNGGTTDLRSGTAGVFNNTSDSADWQNLTNPSNCGGSDAFDACLEPGVLATMSTVDVSEMCALGWSGNACTVPEPPSSSLLIVGCAGFGLVLAKRRRFRPG